jgi:hypothetical protein
VSAQLPEALRGLGVLLGVLASLVMPSGRVAHPHDCFARPSRCGYPDATNSGVPAGTELKRSGPITVSEDGATLAGLDISGRVIVAADDVTIEDTRIVQPHGGSGSYAVILNQGADNFTIRDSEVSGPAGHGPGLESAVWNHYDNPGATATRAYFHRCADCWEGAGTFRDDYMIVDAAYAGSHDEDIYVCGTTVDVDHSTLVNRHSQTATVFGDTAGCGGNRFTVTDSLLAGGGFVVYPQANSSSAVGTMRIAGNRFARCRTRAIYEPGSGGTSCRGEADASGLFPHGGYYGVAADYYRGPGQVWKHNVWDDNGRPVCPAGNC